MFVTFFSGFQRRGYGFALGVLGGPSTKRPDRRLNIFERQYFMHIRKIAAAAALASGAALALAPLASADTIGDAVTSEEALLNSIFVSDATLANIPASDYSLVDGFDVIKGADIVSAQGTSSDPTEFAYLLYGLNPGDNLATDPGSYNVFNGALTEFADAYNVELYSLANPDALVSSVPLDDLFGSSTTIAAALGESTFSAAIGDFVTNGFNDLLGAL
jgi:hypothetical protein